MRRVRLEQATCGGHTALAPSSVNLIPINLVPINLRPIARVVRASILGFGLVHGVSQSATIEVTSHLDDGTDCTLREAINSANNPFDQNNGCSVGESSTTDTIIFSENLASNIITLNSQLIVSGKRINIDASSVSGGLTLDGNGGSRVILLNGTNTVTLHNTTVTGGSTTAEGAGIFSGSAKLTLENSTVTGNTSSEFGGGIRLTTGGTVTLNNSEVSNNHADFGGGLSCRAHSIGSQATVNLNNSRVSGNSATTTGGGLYANNFCKVNVDQSTVASNSAYNRGGGLHVDNTELNITSSTISGNSVEYYGGGIMAGSTDSVSITNSTISGNIANYSGGAIYLNATSLNLSNSTVAANSGGNYGGGIYAVSSSMAFINSIIADTTTDGLAAESCIRSGTQLTRDQSTIVEDGDCLTGPSDDPGLLPLADNGGPTQTHLLSPSSIARDTGEFATCETQDQRGFLRDDGDAACDVGAVEFQPDDDPTGFIVIPLGGKVVVVPN